MMKFHAKQLAILALTLGVAVGCATKPPAPPPPQGPSAATTQAIDEAQAVINGAQAPCTDTGNAADLLAQAQTAAQAGDDQKAQDLAAQAKKTAEDAINNCYLDAARELLTKAQQYTNLNADQQGRLNDGQQAIQNGEGRRAYDVLNALVSELEAARMTYTVVKGDSLWRISGKADVYGNPYEWPLIYKNNTDKIKDADLIYPSQELSVVQHPLKDDADAAIYHAKHRGSWSVGRVEQSDKDYLAGQTHQE